MTLMTLILITLMIGCATVKCVAFENPCDPAIKADPQTQNPYGYRQRDPKRCEGVYVKSAAGEGGLLVASYGAFQGDCSQRHGLVSPLIRLVPSPSLTFLWLKQYRFPALPIRNEADMCIMLRCVLPDIGHELETNVLNLYAAFFPRFSSSTVLK
jgi:hypothetical protein